ncbi:MAG: hypothetical protein EAZ51_00680 [Sphingobacteriales bacterium]|nr:MAG: hypothetical protein EAY72_13465 [Bacteroidota bacterium]TAF83709.1 MAG: hypothetical protein EAZ51_00680 [Sphingobacteriales bacterium]
MGNGLKIIANNIVFDNPNTMGLIGRQKNFVLPLGSVVSIGYLSTWFWDDEAEILVFVDTYSNEFDVNLNYIDEDFYNALSHYTNVNFLDEISRLRNMLNKSAILYSTIQPSSINKVVEIKWTLSNLVKSTFNTFSFKNPLFGFMKVAY